MIQERQILKEQKEMIQMRNYILTIFMFLSGYKNAFSQKEMPVLIDTILVVKMSSFDSQNEIIGSDLYYIYKDSLYNDIISSDSYCDNKYEFGQIYELKNSIQKSKFYSELLSKKTFVKINMDDFILNGKSFFCLDTDCLNNKKQKAQKNYVYVKKEVVIFSKISCNLNDEDVGVSIHYKSFEKLFFPLWKGRFLIPLRFANK